MRLNVLRIPILIIALVIIATLVVLQEVHADGLQWQIPGGIGTVQIPTDPTAILPVIGYDGIQKQLIVGGTTSILTLWKEINGYVGAVGEFQTQAPNIQPYIAVGSDFARYIPALRQVQNLEIHAFVRYVTSTSQHLGAGGAIAYKFGPTAPIIPQAPSEPPAPAATLPPAPMK